LFGPRRRQADAEGEMGADHPGELGDRPHGERGAGQLRRGQGRPDRSDPKPGPEAGQPEHHGECRGSGVHRLRDDSGHPREGASRPSATDPPGPRRAAGGGRGGCRFPGVRRGRLHHRAYPDRGRRPVHVLGVPGSSTLHARRAAGASPYGPGPGAWPPPSLGRAVYKEGASVETEIYEKVKQIIVDQLGKDADEIKPESNFVQDLGADSLDIVELVMAFEEEFDLEIPDDAAEKIATVADAVNYIKEQKG